VPDIFTDFYQICLVSPDFHNSPFITLCVIYPVGSALIHAEGRRDERTISHVTFYRKRALLWRFGVDNIKT